MHMACALTDARNEAASSSSCERRARRQRCHITGDFRPCDPRLPALLDQARADVLASSGVPIEPLASHWSGPRSEVTRRAAVPDLFANDAAVLRVVRMALAER